MSTIEKIRKAIALLPVTPYYNGIGANSKVSYNPKTRTYKVGNEYEGNEAYIFKQICRNLGGGEITESVRQVQKIFDMAYYE